MELRGFRYESSGDSFEAAEGLTPSHDPVKASSFTLALEYDLAGDRWSLEWRRQIHDPLRGSLVYRDVIDEASGYQTGNDSVLNPPDASQIGRFRRSASAR